MSHAPNHGRRPVRRLAAAAAAIVITFGAAATAQGASRATPGLAPADPGVSWLTPRVVAGERWSATIVVTNSASIGRAIRLYAVDATSLGSGAFAPGAEGERRRAGRWLMPAVARVVLGPGESRQVGVRVRVPVGTRPGLHLAAIVAQDADPPRSVGGVRVVARAAVRAYITVSSAPARSRPQTVASAARPLGAVIGVLMDLWSAMRAAGVH